MRHNWKYVVLGISLCSMAFGQGGAITGTVTSAGGAPVSGATVAYNRLVSYLPRVGRSVQLAPGEVVFGTTSTTDATGKHAAQGLPPGNYLVCVDVPAQPLLDPCRWGPAPPVVQVQAGQTAQLNIPLQSGVFLQVRFNDPLGLLPATQTAADIPHVVTGVFAGKGGYLAASRISVDSSGQNYRMAIPTGVPLSLWLFSRHVLLADSAGNAVPAQGSRTPFQASPGVDQVFSVNVTGAAPFQGN